MRVRVIATLLAVAFAGVAAQAQDLVRLKSGKYLCGTVTVDETRDGCTVSMWDTGGVVFVKWTQIPDSEKTRLLSKGAASAPAASIGDVLDGLRVITANREVVGVLITENDQTVSIKTASSAQPTVVPKGAILARETMKIQETEAYSPEEMVAKRAAGDLSPAKCFEVGDFARALKLYAKAKEFYLKAAEADATRKDEATKLCAQVDLLIREADAEKALAAIRKLQEETKYVEAIEAANKFFGDFADTELAKANKDLVKILDKERKEFEANRDKILATRVPELWRSVRSTLWSKYADRKFKFGEARGAVDRLDEEITAELVKKINCTRDEAEKFWKGREQKPMTVAMGSGTWCYKGGQDGGMDYTGTGMEGSKDDPVDDFVKRFGGNKKGGDKKQPELGKKLQTSEEWWSGASTSDRLRWIQCYYALNSAYVTKVKEEERDCQHCKGVGTLKAVRGTKVVDVVCPRCHTVKKDLSVTFW